MTRKPNTAGAAPATGVCGRAGLAAVVPMLSVVFDGRARYSSSRLCTVTGGRGFANLKADESHVRAAIMECYSESDCHSSSGVRFRVSSHPGAAGRAGSFQISPSSSSATAARSCRSTFDSRTGRPPLSLRPMLMTDSDNKVLFVGVIAILAYQKFCTKIPRRQDNVAAYELHCTGSEMGCEGDTATHFLMFCYAIGHLCFGIDIVWREISERPQNDVGVYSATCLAIINGSFGLVLFFLVHETCKTGRI